MTENEAKEKLQAYLECQKKKVAGIYEQCNKNLCDNCELCYAQGNAGEHIASVEAAIQALEEVQQYREIGTVEECWTAMEKQKEKKPLIYQKRKYCVVCGEDVGRYYGNFCRHCGQHIDWSDDDGKTD